MSETFAEFFVKIPSPDRVIRAPGITACHGQRTAGGLKSPLRPTHETARWIRLVELEAMEVLSPQAVCAAEVFVE